MYPDQDTLPATTYTNADGMVVSQAVYPPCDFCGGKTIGDKYQGSSSIQWTMCLNSNCWYAATAQKDRIYNGLIDCEETRRNALQWVTRDQKKKK